MAFLGLLIHPVGVAAIGRLPVDRRVIVEQQESHQAHQHHGAEEEEKHLGGEVGGLILRLQAGGPGAVGGVPGEALVHRLGGVYAADHPNPLDDGHNGGQQATHALPDIVGGEVLGLQAHHEGQEGDRGRAVDGGEEEGQEEEGDAARGTSHERRLPPEESQQETSHGAQTHDGVDDGRLVEGARSEAVHQCDEEGPHVGHLDEDGEVGGQVPALRDLGHDERQLHPEAIDGDPGAHPEQARQQVGEQRHVGRLLLLRVTDVGQSDE